MTDKARKSFALAYELAKRLHCKELTPLHLLYGLLELPHSCARSMLAGSGVSLRALEAHILSSLSAGEVGYPQEGEEIRNILQSALDLALDEGQDYISTDYLVLALSRASPVVSEFLRSFGLDVEEAFLKWKRDDSSTAI